MFLIILDISSTTAERIWRMTYRSMLFGDDGTGFSLRIEVGETIWRQLLFVHIFLQGIYLEKQPIFPSRFRLFSTWQNIQKERVIIFPFTSSFSKNFDNKTTKRNTFLTKKNQNILLTNIFENTRTFLSIFHHLSHSVEKKKNCLHSIVLKRLAKINLKIHLALQHLENLDYRSKFSQTLKPKSFSYNFFRVTGNVAFPHH